MSDLIEREEVIDAICNKCMIDHKTERRMPTLCRNCRTVKIIQAIPSARPKGEWKYCEDDIGHDGYKCSKCGYFVPWCYDVQSSDFIWNYNFCPHCGADMRERKDFQVIVNGNCTKCGKPLSGNRIFICEECEEQSKESE